ncbi:MAG: hypothetical protein K1X67_10415 [Fimbriimonadaceae bacterium]|nr:hypothetical protein [Fimbriimonadaceae bacterium]
MKRSPRRSGQPLGEREMPSKLSRWNRTWLVGRFANTARHSGANRPGKSLCLIAQYDLEA